MARHLLVPRKQRTRQHVIADLSVHYVEDFILEAGHTAQQLERDYGYDLLMFTYDERGYVEPGFVSLQVKAAESLHPESQRRSIVTRTDDTYGQLDKALLSLGFRCRTVDLDGQARVYEHEARPEATIILPAFAGQDRVLDYHLAAVRTTLDLNGIADPREFAVHLKKTA